jgi:ribonuclease HI
VICFDVSYTLKGGGAGIVFIPLEDDVLKFAIQLDFPATNNITEYEGLVTGLRLAKDLVIRRLLIRGNSHLVVKQVQKDFNYNNERMSDYLVEVHRMEKFFDGFKIRYVPRLDNQDVNHLAWISSSRAPTLSDVIVEKLSKPLVKAMDSNEAAVRQDMMVLDESE